MKKDNLTSVSEKALKYILSMLTDKELITLWNTFIEESGIYGLDSYVYDLSSNKESKEMVKAIVDCAMPQKAMESFFLEILSAEEPPRFAQFFALNDCKVHIIKSPSELIKAYWGELFERMMLFPEWYMGQEVGVAARYLVLSMIDQLGMDWDYTDCTLKLKQRP